MTFTSAPDRVFAWPEGDTNQYHYYAAPNPASDPSLCGLEIIDSLDEPDLSYEYNTIIAWRDLATGKVYLAQDSGGSCPRPFEDVDKLSDMAPVTVTADAQIYVRTENTEKRDGSPRFPLRDVLRFLAKIDIALRGEVLAAA